MNVIAQNIKLRKLERKWRKHRSDENYKLLHQGQSKYKNMLTSSKVNHYNNLIKETGKNTKELFNIVKCLSKKNNEKQLPDHTSSEDLANDFNNFF